MNKLAEFYTVVTDAGRELVAQATQAGEKVNITHMAVGDGGGSAVTPDESQTQLVNECWRGLVATYSQQGDSLIIDTYIPPDEGNFTIREMGVFTADGVLFAVCNTPAMPKVLPIKGAVDSFVFGMKLDVTNIDMKYIEIHTNPMLDFIKNSEKGQPDGVPILDEHGKIPADNMPANTPTLGEDGKIPQEQLPELNFDPAGSAAAVQGNLNAHINNKQNPHGVTASLIDAYTKGEINNLINTINNTISTSVVAGTYIGDGAASRFINLGFTPKAVLVFNRFGQARDGNIGDGGVLDGGLAIISNPVVTTLYNSGQYTDIPLLEVVASGFNVYNNYNNGKGPNTNGMRYNYLAIHGGEP